eukprot:1100810-Pleurochrysis_carterae.AAC.1
MCIAVSAASLAVHQIPGSPAHSNSADTTAPEAAVAVVNTVTTAVSSPGYEYRSSARSMALYTDDESESASERARSGKAVSAMSVSVSTMGTSPKSVHTDVSRPRMPGTRCRSTKRRPPKPARHALACTTGVVIENITCGTVKVPVARLHEKGSAERSTDRTACMRSDEARKPHRPRAMSTL